MLDIEKTFDSLPWLAPLKAQFQQWVTADRCPHGLLIVGREGMGRRQLALSFAEIILGDNPARTFASDPEIEAGHPDFVAVEKLWEKKTGKRKQSISVDQIRELAAQLVLTSHGGRGRVAVIYPAEVMTRNAANALLKTLEEPPPNTHIVLVSESLRSLPPTVLSRCQKIRVAPPASKVAADWLRQFAPDKDFTNMLDFVGGAPLAALELHESNFAGLANGLAGDLQQLEQRRTSPTRIAAKWAKQPDLALQWLYWMLARRVRSGLEEPANTDNSAMLEAAFGQMDQIRELRSVLKTGINAELNIVGLLMDWYGGLGQH